MTTRKMRIILPGAVLAAGLALAACGGGNACKRACHKLESCLEEAAGGTSGITLTGTTDCGSIDTCDAQSACQADCMLAASCSELLGGASSVSSCVAQCGVPRTAPSTDGGGVLQPLPSPDTGTCTPDCYGKQCGDDGCGGSCGSCGYTETCSYGVCIGGSSCTPDCYGLQCGDDGCGGSCGSCSYSETCSYGSCVSSYTGSTNSGALCSDTTSCQSGEQCMLFDEYATYGMCLGQCTTVGDYCATGSSSQLAICALTSQSAGGNFCAFICEIQGQTYACPNSYDYVCAVFDTTQPDIKLCMPK